MNRLTSYILTGIIRGTAVVTVALVAVASVIELVGQLDDVGLGSYGLREAIAYVALRIPRKIFDVLPAAALVGALLRLGNMAVHRELVVMRASGVSQYRLLGSAAMAGVVLCVAMFLLGESLAPSLSAYARTMRDDSLLEDVDRASAQSAWFRDGDRIFNLRRPRDSVGFERLVTVFELDGDFGLKQVAEAELLTTGRSSDWDMLDYDETTFGDEGTSARSEERLQIDYGLNQDMLELSEVREDLFDMRELARYIEELQANSLDATRYLAAYWGRIANGVSVIFMTMLALPFVLGSLRSAGAGARMVVGLIIGLGYYVLGELSVSLLDVFRLDPVVAAWAPSGLLLLITLVAVARLR